MIHRGEDSRTGRFPGFHFSAAWTSDGNVAYNDETGWSNLTTNECDELLHGASGELLRGLAQLSHLLDEGRVPRLQHGVLLAKGLVRLLQR